MRDHTKLRAFVMPQIRLWRKLADEVVVLIYRLTGRFPKEEIYGLTSQMRRSAVSVPSNIVEGCACGSQADCLHFLEIAFSSLRELHYQFGLSMRLGYSAEHDISGCDSNILETEKVLGALIRSIRKN
ncbi:four helix bundle protein [Verrucomicrobiota bacterium]